MMSELESDGLVPALPTDILSIVLEEELSLWVRYVMYSLPCYFISEFA